MKRQIGLITVSALVFSSLVGSLQLAAHADESKSTTVEEVTGSDKPGDARTMAIRVLDETGQPIPEANVRVRAWAVGGVNDFPNENYTTDDRGEVKIGLPCRIRMLQIWPSKVGYVSVFVNFAEGTHEEGRLIPDKQEFRLPPGSRLSGTVVDEDGNPIPNAEVQVRVDVDQTSPAVSKINPMISAWLALGEHAAVTDADGRWIITNAPMPKKGSDFKFRLQVNHPEFAGDTRWAGLQEQQGVTTEQLRAGTAKLRMDRGIAISGLITGPDGRPVTKGLVIWDDRPYWVEGLNETPIDAAGQYETKRHPPGEYNITVLAPGFAPQQRKVQVSQSTRDVDFQLAPGSPIKIQIVDPSGNPIRDADVGIASWRGTDAIYNNQQPNTPESGIPRRANQDGIYAWNWAPSDGVRYRISAKGYDEKEVTLVAKNDAHRVELGGPITIYGKVVDAQTRKPVGQFRVLSVKAFRPDFYSTDFQDGNVAQAQNGEYTIRINSHGQTGNRYRVRIEAEGYRTAFGQKSLAAGDPPLEENFELEPAPALIGNVRDSSGGPVNDFAVAVGTPTTGPQFYIDRLYQTFGVAFRVKGTNQFELPATFEPRRIRVFNDAGFVEVLRQPDEPIGDITLQPWASLSGRLIQDGIPIPGEQIYFRPLATRGLTEARFQDSFTTKSDMDGYFHFDRLPPMSGTLKAFLGPWRESPLTSSKSVPLELKPGDRQDISLGGEGTVITGRVVATGRSNDHLSKKWSLNYLVSRDRGVAYPSDAELLSFDGTGPLDPAWLRQPDFETWTGTRENHFVKLDDGGRLWIHGVPAGEYDLVVQLYEEPAGCLVETIGERVIPITITDAQAGDGEVEIGDIEVECRIGPRVGSDMRAFEFTDADGRVQTIGETAGRYVLFHVWASWCQPCLESIPDVKSAAEQHSDDGLTMVGLNVDEDTSSARGLVEEGGWNWAQNYLGDDSDIMRQLAVSSVPAYYLIGPDGKLAGSANSWPQMQEILGTRLP